MIGEKASILPKSLKSAGVAITPAISQKQVPMQPQVIMEEDVSVQNSNRQASNYGDGTVQANLNKNYTEPQVMTMMPQSAVTS